MKSSKLFGAVMLKQARIEAKKNKVKIPKLSTWSTTAGTNPYYEVYDDHGDCLWCGKAFSAYEAKSNAINILIESASK